LGLFSKVTRCKSGTHSSRNRSNGYVPYPHPKKWAITDRPKYNERSLKTLQTNLPPLLIRQLRPRLVTQWPSPKHLHRTVRVIHR